MANASQILVACGSFNPVTVMHLRMFELARHHLRTKRSITVHKGIISPTNDSYATIKPSLSPAHHRIAMIKLALSEPDKQWIICDEWETKQKHWVLTLPSLEHLESVYGRNLRLLCGVDLLESFLVPGLWSDEHIEKIIQRYGIVALPRLGSNPWKLIHDSEKSPIFQRNLQQIDIIDDIVPVNVSSTMVRESVKLGKPIDQLVHRDVADYIESKGLYKY